MNEFKIISAEVRQTKATADQPSQDYLACTVAIDNTLAHQAKEKLYGRKIFLSQGGQSYNYPVLKGDASYPDIEAWIKAKAADPAFDVPFIIEGEIHTVPVPDYYIINPRTGKPVLNANGQQEIGKELVFFCPAGNSAVTIARRLARNLTQVAPAAVADSHSEAVLA